MKFCAIALSATSSQIPWFLDISSDRMANAVTIIVALAAIISPVITAIINNRHQRKMRELELKEQQRNDVILHKREIFEGYLQYAGACVAHAEPSELQNYGGYYQLALFYAPPELHREMLLLHDEMREYKWDDAKTTLNAITIALKAFNELNTIHM